MHRRVGTITCLLLGVCISGPAFADVERCERATEAQQSARETARREAERYLACISTDDSERDCATQFQSLSAAHADLITARWLTVMECG